MKFLEYTSFGSLNSFLNHLNLGESTLKGSLEAYSCKQTGTDRKMSISLEQEILGYLGQSLDRDSPPEYLCSKSSRKTLIYLILTLNHMYPDYDFSIMQAHHFFREETWDNVAQVFNTYMFEAAKEWNLLNEGSTLLESVKKSIDEVVELADCEIYSYNPDFEGDPLQEIGIIWSFIFFFYNRKLKRVVSFRCCSSSNLMADGFQMDGTFDLTANGDYIFDDIDM